MIDPQKPVIRRIPANDPYLSNWFELRLPKVLYAHRFRGPASSLPAVAASFPHPHRILGSWLLTFAPVHEVMASLGGGWCEEDLTILKTDAFLAEGSERLRIAGFDAGNIVTDLVRQAWEAEMRRQGLRQFELASGLMAWFFENGHLEKNKAFYTPPRGKRTYRQLVGLKSKRTLEGGRVADGYWHYALSASPQLFPFCQSARNGDPGSACKRDPCAGEVEGAGVVDAEP